MTRGDTIKRKEFSTIVHADAVSMLRCNFFTHTGPTRLFVDTVSMLVYEIALARTTNMSLVL